MKPSGDPWLDPWLELIEARAAGGPVLELGCGPGRDTEVVAARGLPVVALDRSPEAVAEARVRVPAAQVFRQDVRDPFPAAGAQARVVLASLSLHYFSWAETVALVERIHSLLAPDGLLLCRLNSTRDVHHGAVGEPEIEQDFYQVGDVTKRFFDRAAVETLFGAAAWRTLSLREQTIHRYARPKVVWEIVAEAIA
jgi:trans-aconitate methyltransferase